MLAAAEESAGKQRLQSFNFLNKAVTGFAGTSTGDDVHTYTKGTPTTEAVNPTNVSVPIGTPATKTASASWS